MPGDEIDAIPGLEEKHRRALASKLGITSLQALADGDQRAIYNALASFRPRPTPELVEAWQDEARRRLSDAANGRSAWHTAASFAVIFAQRQVDGRWERRLEAEQTEVEPAPEPQQWATWDCGPLCDWMLGQLGLPEDEADAAGQAAAAAEPSPLPGARCPGARCPGARCGKRCARTSRAAYQRRHDHRGRPRLGADQRRPSRHGPARRSTAPCPPALHRARSASRPTVAGGRMVPPPGRARLEPAGTGDRSRLG